jgi:hypothetical protein
VSAAEVAPASTTGLVAPSCDEVAPPASTTGLVPASRDEVAA